MLALRNRSKERNLAIVGMVVAGLLANPFHLRADDPPAPPPPPSSLKVQIPSLGCNTDVGSGAFDAVSWTTGTSTITGSSIGGGSSASRPQLRDLRVVKSFDECSAALFAGSVAGKHFNILTLTQSDAKDKPMMTVVLTDVLVSSLEFVGNTETPAPVENVTFSYGTITINNRLNGSKACFDTKTQRSC